MLNAQPIARETPLCSLPNIGHHPHLVGGGVVSPRLITVDAVISRKVERIVDGQFHALVGNGFASNGTRSSIVNKADPLRTAVSGLVVYFPCIQHTITCRAAVVAVVQAEGHETSSCRAPVGFAEANGIAEHHAGRTSPSTCSVGTILTVCTVTHVDGFIDFVNGKIAIAVVINTDMKAHATFDTNFAGVINEGLDQSGISIRAVDPVRSVRSIRSVHTVEAVGPVQAIKPISPGFALLALLSLSTVGTIDTVAHAPREGNHQHGNDHREQHMGARHELTSFSAHITLFTMFCPSIEAHHADFPDPAENDILRKEVLCFLVPALIDINTSCVASLS